MKKGNNKNRIHQAYQAFYNDFKDEYPEFAEHFQKFWKRKMEDRVFNYKEMELFRLFSGLLQKCNRCIEIHLKSAMEAGATRIEILEIATLAGTLSNQAINDNIKYLLKLLGGHENEEIK